MPLTRKSDNKQVKAHTAKAGISENVKTNNGKEGTPKEKQKDAILEGKKQTEKKEEIGDKTGKLTLAPKQEEKSEDGLVMKDVKALSSKKRKSSDTMAEPSKRTKVLVPDVISPRRSSRAVVPNSRYKDMEVMEIGKKKSGTSSTTGHEKKLKEKTHMAKYQGQKLYQQGSQSNVVSEEVITCETEINGNLQMNLMDDILLLSSNMAEIQHQTVASTNHNKESDGSLTDIDRVHSEHEMKAKTEGLEMSNIVSSVISTNENTVSQSQVQDFHNVVEGMTKVVKISENKSAAANVIVISNKDKDKNPELEANNLRTPSLPKIINVPKGVTIIKKVGSHNMIKQTGKTIEMKGDGLQVVNNTTAFSKSGSAKSQLEIIDGAVRAPVSISSSISGSTSKLTDVKDTNFDTFSASYENAVPGMDQVLVETTSDGPVNSDCSKEAVKPHVNIVYVKVKPKNTNPLSEKESNMSSSVSSDVETNNTPNIMSFDPSDTENNLSTDTIEAQNNNSNEDVYSGAIEIESKNLLDTQMFETDNQGTLKAIDANELNEESKPNGSVCEVFTMDKPAVESPQVAIEYVVFGDRIVPIHKPFSQSNAGIYKKISTNSKTLKKIPVKVAQTAINSLLEGKPHNTAYSIDTADIGEDETAVNEPTVQQQATVVLDNQQHAVGTTNEGEVKMITTADKPQQKHGRVIHGYVSKLEPRSGPTEIVEISQDLFTKEVYGDSAILDHVTGELVASTSLSTDDVIENSANEGHADDRHFVELKPDGDTVSNDMIVAGMMDSNQTGSINVVDMAPNVTTIGQDPGQLQTVVKDVSDSPTQQPFSIENMMEGDSVVLQIDDNGIIMNETPAYKTLTNLKISPAAPVVSSDQSTTDVHDGEIEESKQTEYTAVPTIQIKPVTAGPSLQKETETQTDIAEEEEDVQSNVDYSEETIATTDTNTDSTNKSVIVVKKEEDSIRRTTVRMEENGVVQEYVVVHLPEGTEIKQQEVKQSVQDPVHNEPITQRQDGLYFCVDCDHTTDRRGNWYKHRRKHLGIRPHSCPKCDYKAATSSNLKRHMQIHDDVRNFECTVCGLFFRQKIHLERHIKYKHQEKKVKCPLCDYMCSSENPDLKIHIRRRHMPQEDGSMSAFTCNECGLMTVSKKDLKQHMKFHKRGPELKLFCEFCSFVTDCESRLRRHMLIHTKEKPFQCGLCSYRATQKEHVLRHMKTQHDVEVERKTRKSLLAPEPKSKPRRSLLESNQQPLITVTEPTQANKLFEKSDYSCTDKIFACNHCSMKFSKLINLYKHLFAQHKQVMPDTSTNFQCVVCDFRTNNKKNLLVHMRKHNMQDHSPPTHVYSCVLCRYINPRRRNLFQHMKKKHNIQIMMKDDGSECFVGGDVIVEQQDGEQGIMALSEIVTTHPLVDDSQLQIITEDGTSFQAEKITLDNLMSVEDISAYETISSQESIPSNMTTIAGTSFQQTTVAGHEAAEAIEGLQALAEQAAGVVETHPIDSDISTEIITSEIMTDGEILTTGEETHVEKNDDDGIELSSEQLNQLSAGDYVEINGEVYKVEISQENTQK